MLKTQTYGRTLQMTSEGDIYLDDDLKMQMIDGTDKVLQDIRMVLHTVVGSWEFDMTFGTDHPAIVESGYHETLIRGKISTALSNLSSVKQVRNVYVVKGTSNRVSVFAEIVLQSDETVRVTETVQI